MRLDFCYCRRDVTFDHFEASDDEIEDLTLKWDSLPP